MRGDMLHVTGWYDSVPAVRRRISPTCASGRRTSRRRPQSGRSLDSGTRWSMPTRQSVRLTSAPKHYDLLGGSAVWFDHWMKGIDNGVNKESACRLFVRAPSLDSKEKSVRSREPIGEVNTS